MAKFDNLENLMKLRSKMYIYAFITIALATMGVMTQLYTDYLIPIEGWYYSVFFIMIYALYLIYRNFLQYHYIEFSDDGPKVILRYFRFGGITQQYRSIEIIKTTLYTFEFQKQFFNRRPELIIFQKTPKGVAKYPPVPVTALTPEQLSAITQILTMYATKGKK
jgi:hypothetical protein